MRWKWDENKSRTNRQKHKIGFETAQLVFDDPYATLRRDPYPHEERWQTIGKIGNVTVIVIHTWPRVDHGTGEEAGRIISARKATPHERTLYEEGDF